MKLLNYKNVVQIENIFIRNTLFLKIYKYHSCLIQKTNKYYEKVVK